MSIRLMAQIWDNPDILLRGTKLNLLLALADYANDDGVCWPSYVRLAVRTRCSKRAVIDLVAELETHGFIKVSRTAGRPNNYTVYATPIDTTLSLFTTVEAYAEGSEAAFTSEAGFTTENDESSEAGFTSEAAFTGEVFSEVVKQGSPEPSLEPSKREREGARARTREGPRAKPAKPVDLTMTHPAIQHYRDAMHITPNLTQREAIVAAVTLQHTLDLERWHNVLQLWNLRGWNPRNVQGQLEVFSHYEKMAAQYNLPMPAPPTGPPRALPAEQSQMSKLRAGAEHQIQEA